MKVDNLVAGAVIRLPGTGSTKDGRRTHAFIVIGETNNGDFLVVPICSLHPKCDQTCKIQPREFPILSHESYAAFYQAKLIPKQGTINRINCGEVPQSGNISLELFERIKTGLASSTETEPYILTAFKALK
jgi:hypothetical protein